VTRPQRSSGNLVVESKEESVPNRSRPTVIIVGAHPDDIEIGAAGTVGAFRQAGIDVLAVVVTDEQEAEVAETRRAETRSALRLLGVPADCILFLGIVDGQVPAAMPELVAALQNVRAAEAAQAVVMISHTEHDHHPDHRAIHAAVERSAGDFDTVLSMCIVNSVLEGFAPSLAVDTTDFASAKAAALDEFPSQDIRGRIRRDDIATIEAEFGSMAGVERAEAFEIIRMGDSGMIDALPGVHLLGSDPIPAPSGGADVAA
jgi:LmbE family N-acetylglucosaminyl deacetylase